MMAGTMVVAVYEHTADLKYRLAAAKIRQAFEDYPCNSDGGFWHARSLPHEMWIDGVFMGQMFLTRYGAVIGDRDYCFDEATRQILILASHCRKGDTGLFLHAYDESRNAAWTDPATGLSPEVWSEGLGWYALVLVESLMVLPLDHPSRPQVVKILLTLVEGLRKTQDANTGLWYQIVDKGDRPDNWHDTSGSAMFLYTIQRAIDLGFVGAEKYGLSSKEDTRGLFQKPRLTWMDWWIFTTLAMASAFSPAMLTTSIIPRALTLKKQWIHSCGLQWRLRNPLLRKIAVEELHSRC